MSRSPPRHFSHLLLGTAALACTVRALDDGTTDAPAATTAASTSTDPTTSAPQPTTALLDPTTSSTGATTASDDSSAAVDPTTSGFIRLPDGLQGGKFCDPWLQDCPEGQKCAAVSLDGDYSWESLACVPVVRDPAGVDEPCENLGTGVDGLDTCAKGHMCWNIDPETDAVCVAQCIGGPERPECADPAATCSFSSRGILILCFPDCDPLLQDCPGNDLCVPNPQDSSQEFACVIDASGDEGQTFDLCAELNACDPGLLCLDPALASECDPQGEGCCLPLCDLSAPLDCPGADQQCLPWFEEGAAPPQYENVGVCGLPS